jgi:hypothetical protein
MSAFVGLSRYINRNFCRSNEFNICCSRVHANRINMQLLIRKHDASNLLWHVAMKTKIELLLFVFSFFLSFQESTKTGQFEVKNGMFSHGMI